MAASITLDDLAKRLDGFEFAARQNFANDGKLAPVTLLGATRDHQGNVLRPDALVVLPWAELPPDKDALRHVQQQMIATFAAAWIVNVTEGWLAELPASSDPRLLDLSKLEPPSKRPDRIEVIIIRGECAAGAVQRQIKILRKPGKRAALGESEETRQTGEEYTSTGLAARFAGYFLKLTEA